MRFREEFLVVVSFLLFLGLGYAQDKEKFVYPDDIFRDPFEPLVSKNGDINVKLIKQRGSLHLNGIVYDETDKQGSFALINNNLVKTGDIIGKYKVERIEKNKVVLKRGDKEVILNSEGGEK